MYCSDKAIESKQLKGEAAVDFRAHFVYVFKEILIKNAKQVTEEEMVERMTNEYTKNKTKFVQDIRTIFGLFVRIIDTNEDGKISKEELQNMMHSYGLHTFDDKYYNSFPHSEDGTIPADLFLQGFCEFVCNDDKDNVSSLERARLYAFRLIDDI